MTNAPSLPTEPCQPVSGQGTVLIVDGDAIRRQSLLLTLRASGLRALAFESAAGYMASERPPGPICLVLGLGLTRVDGFDLQAQVTRASHPPIVFVTASREVSSCVSAMKAGAIDYLLQPFAAEELLIAIHEALARDVEAERQRSLRSQLQERYSSLTPREREVLSLVVGGLLNKQAGAALGISEITLKSHRGRVMQKMAADSFADLVRMAGQLRVPLPRTGRRGSIVDVAGETALST